jgi:3-oxoacyl-[acyl-carrier protein] reductase
MKISFKGKNIRVGGGSHGIGRSIALAFAASGANLAICARGVASLRAAEAELNEIGTKIVGIECDLGDEQQVIRFVKESADALGGVDVLTNNASGLGLRDDASG